MGIQNWLIDKSGRPQESASEKGSLIPLINLIEDVIFWDPVPRERTLSGSPSMEKGASCKELWRAEEEEEESLEGVAVIMKMDFTEYEFIV